jgi:hypothetical protein
MYPYYSQDGPLVAVRYWARYNRSKMEFLLVTSTSRGEGIEENAGL